MKRYDSRKSTPWEDSDLTLTQEFLKQHYDLYYSDCHRKVGESGEADAVKLSCQPQEQSLMTTKYP